MVDRFFGPDEPWPNELGDMVRYSDYAALKAENERLTKALSEQIDRDISGIFPSERARAGGVKAARDAVERLAHTKMDLSLAEWSEIASTILSALTTEPAAPEGRQEAVALPPYGNMPFDELGRDVSEAVIGIRHDFDFGETYPGHVMTGINFNSLNRIVSKYVTRPAEQAVTEAMIDKFIERYELGCSHRYDRNSIREALKAAMEAGRHD